MPKVSKESAPQVEDHGVVAEWRDDLDGYTANFVTFRYADGEEVFETGDAFYTPPGHIPVQHEPGTEFVMFSPAEALRETDAVMMKNMQALQAG